MEGTRTKVLDDLVLWATKAVDNEAQSGSYNMFWLYGMPGLGKTSVANSLCDRLRKTGNLGGSFICKHDNPSLREPEAVLPTLVAKLVRMWGPFRKLVAQVLHDEPQIDPTSTRGDLLLKPLRLLKKHPPGPLILVIDALDECGKHYTRRPLLNCLMEACSIVHWLKVVITGRPESDITSFFEACNATSLNLATDDLGHKDIRLFTEHRVTSIASRRHLPSDWPGEEIVNKIVERSDGLFIFVETLYRLVDVPEPDSLLAQVLGGESQGANTTLHHLYSMAIASRIAQPTPAFHSILRAIIAVSANRPLSDETLAELICLEARVVRAWVDELSSLLYRDPSTKGGIRVRHLSVLEFLVGSTCPPEFRVELNRVNSELARCCLGTMADQLKFNICELETSYLANSEIQDLDGRVEQKIPDALQYSCMYWASHLCYDGNLVSAEISRRLDAFFGDSQPLYWLEVLSLMGKVPLAISALRLMKAHFKVCILILCTNIS
jgi:NACHT domain